MVEYNTQALDEDERKKNYNIQFGLMNPNLSN